MGTSGDGVWGPVEVWYGDQWRWGLGTSRGVVWGPVEMGMCNVFSLHLAL